MSSEMNIEIDWKQYLAKLDPIWTKMPFSWLEGAFLGNGLLGAMIYGECEKGAGPLRLSESYDASLASGIRFEIGRSDVTDGGEDAPGNGNGAAQFIRVPIGGFILTPAGRIKDVEMRLDLWNAEIRGELTTSAGKISWRTFVHATTEIAIVEIEASAGEAGYLLELRLEGHHSAIITAPTKEVLVAKSLHDDRSESAVGWQFLTISDDRRRLFFSAGNDSVKRLNSYDDPRTDLSAEDEAREYITLAAEADFDDLLADHRAWWRGFYQKSFLSVPDPRIEAYYWIQLYKMASATRPDKPAIDLIGPWSTETGYMSFVWNLNVQLTYWPQLASNHLELGESLFRLMERSTTKSATFHGSTIGADGSSYLWDGAGSSSNLVWVCHNLYLTYRYSMDGQLLRERVFPQLKLAINGMFEQIEDSHAEVWHLHDCLSPEYRGNEPFVDSNYEISLFRWGCKTLLSIAELAGIDDPDISKWEEALKRIADYPIDRNGYMIDRRNPLIKGHRHFSHLLMIYPLYLINWDRKENREIIKRSVNHWMSLPPDHKGRTGYAYTGAASMFASMGDGNRALTYLISFLDGISRSKFPIVHPNTMYREYGPCIESPLSFAKSVQDMLLQSWGGCIRIFPAIPDSWWDVSMHDMRAEGAFLVSAVRKDGATKLIRVMSLAGEKCLIRTDMPRPIRICFERSGGIFEHRDSAEEPVEISLKKNDTAILFHDDADRNISVAPVEGFEESYNYFGLNMRYIKK